MNPFDAENLNKSEVIASVQKEYGELIHQINRVEE
jgi:hypothetical protein